MRPFTAGEDEGSEDSNNIRRDLMCGIGTLHIRQLCNNEWEGGRSYTPSQVGAMTLDQIFTLLCDQRWLKTGTNTQAVAMGSLEVADLAKGGKIKARAVDGTIIEGKVVGKSLASRLAEAEAEKASKSPAASAIVQSPQSIVATRPRRQRRRS